MPVYCKDNCINFNKVPQNLKENKKYCRVCQYNIITNDIRCKCCNMMLRSNRQKYDKPTGGEIGRPKKEKELKTTVHPLFQF